MDNREREECTDYEGNIIETDLKCIFYEIMGDKKWSWVSLKTGKVYVIIDKEGKGNYMIITLLLLYYLLLTYYYTIYYLHFNNILWYTHYTIYNMIHSL